MRWKHLDEETSNASILWLASRNVSLALCSWISSSNLALRFWCPSLQKHRKSLILLLFHIDPPPSSGSHMQECDTSCYTFQLVKQKSLSATFLSTLLVLQKLLKFISWTQQSAQFSDPENGEPRNVTRSVVRNSTDLKPWKVPAHKWMTTTSLPTHSLTRLKQAGKQRPPKLGYLQTIFEDPRELSGVSLLMESIQFSQSIYPLWIFHSFSV